MKRKNQDKDIPFGFEELQVWSRAVDFAAAAIDLSENLNSKNKHFRLLEQLEACAASIAMNLAEGKGRHSKKEFMQFCFIARGSLYECITLLEIFSRKGWVTEDDYFALRNEGKEIASMIKGLINAIRNSMD